MDKIKVAISAKKDGLDGEVSDVFGRSPYFIVAEIAGGKIEKTEIIENKSMDQMGGAGISTAQLMAEKDVKAVITGNVGPRASDVLKQFDITVYYGEGIIKDVLHQFIEGKLKKII
jgi:predicted Fe-Mo cluster-binding NifX family protein